MDPVDRADAAARGIDAMFEAFIAPNQPGAMVAVVAGEQIVHLKAYGLAVLETATPWTSRTVSYVASITKHFVATALLILEDRGLLTLDDPVRNHLPELPAALGSLRLRHLVTNTAGLIDDEALMGMAGISDESPCSLDYLLNIVIAQARLHFTPGQHYLYGNTPFRLLAHVIERCSGTDFDTFLRDAIFVPAGMTASAAPRGHDEVFTNAATGYSAEPHGRFRIFRMGCECSGDGAMRTTVADLLRWNRALRDNTLGIRDFVTRLTAIPELNEPGETTTYACGTKVTTHRGLRCIGHGGTGAGYRAEFLRIPGADLMIIALANRHDAMDHWDLYRIADLYLPSQSPTIAAPSASPATWSNDQLAGCYLNRDSGYFIDLENSRDGLVAYLMGDKDTAVLNHVGGNRFIPIRGAFSFPIRIETAADGVTPTLHMQPGDSGELAFKRIVPEPPTAQEEATLAGLYYSKELAAIVTIQRHNGQLCLRRGQGATAQNFHRLLRLGPDAFRADYTGDAVMWPASRPTPCVSTAATMQQ